MTLQAMLKTGLTIMLLAVLPAGTVMAANIYKYRDNNGNEILGSQVPAEFVKNGYLVLDERGRVIQEVPRTLSEAERAAQSGEAEQQRLAQEARRKQEEEDTMLLRLYRTPEEVIRRRDSLTEELDAQIETLSALLRDAQGKIGTLQKRADDNVAAGREVPADVTAQLEDAVEERDRLDRQRTRMETEKADAIATAQKNIDRLKVLLNLD